MSTPALDALLEELAHGDSEAAERVIREYEPYLRSLVRRKLTPMLRSKFDSVDVVQSVWAGVLQGYRDGGWRFDGEAHLRAFLARVTYNHFATHCRRHRTALEHERSLDGDVALAESASGQPRPSQVAQAAEMWATLMALCPPAHRPILELKGQGVPLAEIAERTGLHESSVRRILYDLAKRLAAVRKRAAAG
jgi:RNA polymerase sigma-70 factor (ECF subfamily)